MKLSLILFLSSFLLIKSSSAQEESSIYHWTTENGLPSNGIKGLQFDPSTGFLWIASEAGLIRFNGIEFTTFQNGNSQQVITDRMYLLVKNIEGRIYAEDNTGRIFVVNRHKIKFYENNPEAYRDSDNSFSLAVSEKLHHRGIVPVKSTFIDMSIGQAKVLPIADTACVIVLNGNLYRFSAIRPTPVLLSLPIKNIRYAFVNRGHYFLVDVKGHGYELNILDFTLRKINSINFNPLTDALIWESGMEAPILFSGKKAFLLQYENGKLITVPIFSSIPQNLIIKSAQYYQPGKMLVIGTESDGIYLVKKHSLEPILNRKANQTKSFYAQLVLPDSTTILTNSGQVLGKNEPRSEPPIKGVFGHFLLREDDSLLWYVKQNPERLHRYDYRSGTTTAYSKTEISVQTPMVRTENRLYVISPTSIFFSQGDSLQLLDNRIPNAKIGWPLDAKEIKPGVIAIACGSYLFRYTIANQKIDTLLYTGNSQIRSLWIYKDYIFIGTYGKGIFVSKNGKTKTLPLDRNKHLLFTHCFVKDEQGYCWISSNKGLFKASLVDMIYAFENDDPDIYYHYFGKSDGMATTEMNGGCMPCAVELKDKTISFPTMLGLLWVNPSLTKPVLPWKSIFVDRFLVNKRTVDNDSLNLVELPSNTTDIRIKLAYPVWENQENIYIKYRLDEDTSWNWLNTGTGDHINLMNLGYGKHNLLIRKINGFGLSNFTDHNIAFSIKTPWYKAWWFYTMSFLFVIGLIYLYIRIRTRQYLLRERKLERLIAEKVSETKEQYLKLEKNDAIKTRLISIISHDIVTPLKFMATVGQNIYEKRNQMSEATLNDTIHDIVKTSKELQSLSTNILNWIKFQTEGKGLEKVYFPLSPLIDQILYLLNPIASRKGLKIINQADSELKIYQYYEPIRIMVYNVVSNAVNFSEKGIILVNTIINDDLVTIEITDEGSGMTAEQVRKLNDQLGSAINSITTSTNNGTGLGYLIIKDLARLTNVAVKIDSKIGVGTKVSFTFLNHK
jgi:signal transduction histidine kinase/ligand-binding sensor domain-containing protein